MKVKLRTLKQEKYEIEIDGQETVSKLKELIEERHQIDRNWQILIFSGKVLDNDKTIESYKIEEKDFLVLMVKKPAETSEKKVNAPQPAQPAPAQPAPAQPAPAGTPEPQLQPSQAPQASLVTIDEAAITKLADMGFPRDQAEAALRAAFGIADRAVDYLFNGIPDNLIPAQSAQPQTAPAQPAPAQPAQAQPPPAQPQQPGARPPGIFDALRNHPQFPELCRLAQTGGEDALKQILTYFAQANPDLIQTIVAHQNEFIQLLNEPLPNQPPRVGVAPAGPRGAAAPGVVRLQVTPADEQVINNFIGMGFDRNRVLEAYFLFEKDQAMTAEYLLNNLNDDDEDMGGDAGGEGGDGGAGLYGDDDDDEEFDDVGGPDY